MSTMPGEGPIIVFAGVMEFETIHFLESVLLNRPADARRLSMPAW